MSAVRLTQSSQSSGMHEESADAAAAVAVMSSGEYKSIPIRDSNRLESIRFVKNRPFDSLVVMQFFLLTAYLLYSLSQKIHHNARN